MYRCGLWNISSDVVVNIPAYISDTNTTDTVQKKKKKLMHIADVWPNAIERGRLHQVKSRDNNIREAISFFFFCTCFLSSQWTKVWWPLRPCKLIDKRKQITEWWKSIRLISELLYAFGGGVIILVTVGFSVNVEEWSVWHSIGSVEDGNVLVAWWWYIQQERWEWIVSEHACGCLVACWRECKALL